MGKEGFISNVPSSFTSTQCPHLLTVQKNRRMLYFLFCHREKATIYWPEYSLDTLDQDGCQQQKAILSQSREELRIVGGNLCISKAKSLTLPQGPVSSAKYASLFHVELR